MELYLCSEECNNTPSSCYVIRCIKLTDLLACSCGFDQESGKIINCDRCVSKGQKRANYELQTRAWIRGKQIPISMGFCSSGSQIFFGGGKVLKPTSTGDIYRFETDSGVFQKYPVNFLNKKLDALLFQVNGDLYALAGNPATSRPVTFPSFEVHKLGSNTWEALPDTPFYHPQVFGHFYTGPKPGTKFSYAIVDTKILVSTKHDTTNKQEEYPVMCFDVAKGKSDWTQVSDSFFKSESNKSLPFVGGALVLKLEGSTSTHVMFSYHENFDIEACLLVENDDGSIKSSQHQFVGINSRLSNLMSTNYYDSRLAAYPLAMGKSFGFVHLGQQNICFVNSMTIQTIGKGNSREFQTERLLFIVFTCEVSNSGSLSFEVLATRIFEYQCLSPSMYFPKLLGCFVL